MQSQYMFTVYDEKAEAFLPPFFVPSKGLAIRAFTDCINSKDHYFGKHPADYTLFQIGVFHDTTGEIELIDKKSIGNGVEFRETLNQQLGATNGTQDASILSDENSGDSA